MKHKNFFFALATYVGTIIGVGIFAIPFVGASAGFLITALYIIGIGCLAAFINFLFATIAIQTCESHRLPGYAGLYLGAGAKRAAFLVLTLSLFGALLAYLIVGGQFLANMLGGSVYLYTFIFFILCAFLIWRGQRSIGVIELILLVVFLLAVLVLVAGGVGHIKSAYLTTSNLRNFFIPYGVILFSLWGTPIIPQIKEMVGSDWRQLKRVIFWGMAICVIVYLIFAWVVIGVSGNTTTLDAITGLRGRVGDWVLTIGYLFGIITTLTSFIALGLTVKKMFTLDYKLPRFLAWALACGVPLVLYLLGLQNFIAVISLTGALMLALEGMFIAVIYRQLRETTTTHFIRGRRVFVPVIIGLLILGMAAEIFYFFNGY